MVSICQNQFAVIGQVFPPPLVAKVTRLLLSRILNDPVYGVQVGVVLAVPPPPPPPEAAGVVPLRCADF